MAPTVSSDLEEMFDVTSLLTEDLLGDALDSLPEENGAIVCEAPVRFVYNAWGEGPDALPLFHSGPSVRFFFYVHTHAAHNTAQPRF